MKSILPIMYHDSVWCMMRHPMMLYTITPQSWLFQWLGAVEESFCWGIVLFCFSLSRSTTGCWSPPGVTTLESSLHPTCWPCSTTPSHTLLYLFRWAHTHTHKTHCVANKLYCMYLCMCVTFRVMACTAMEKQFTSRSLLMRKIWKQVSYFMWIKLWNPKEADILQNMTCFYMDVCVASAQSSPTPTCARTRRCRSWRSRWTWSTSVATSPCSTPTTGTVAGPATALSAEVVRS